MSTTLKDYQMMQQGLRPWQQLAQRKKRERLLDQASQVLQQPGGGSTQDLMSIAKESNHPMNFMKNLTSMQQLQQKEIMQKAGSKIARMMDDGKFDPNELRQIDEEFHLGIPNILRLAKSVQSVINPNASKSISFTHKKTGREVEVLPSKATQLKQNENWERGTYSGPAAKRKFGRQDESTSEYEIIEFWDKNGTAKKKKIPADPESYNAKINEIITNGGTLKEPEEKKPELDKGDIFTKVQTLYRQKQNLTARRDIQTQITDAKIEQAVKGIDEQIKLLSEVAAGRITQQEYFEKLGDLPEIPKEVTEALKNDTENDQENQQLMDIFSKYDPGIYEYKNKKYRWDGNNITEVE